MNEYQARLRAYRKAAGTGPDARIPQSPVVPETPEAAPVESGRTAFQPAQWWPSSKNTTAHESPSGTAPDQSPDPEPVQASADTGARERAVALLLQSLSPEESARILRVLPADVSERVASRALTMESPSEEDRRRAFDLLKDIPGISRHTAENVSNRPRDFVVPAAGDLSTGWVCAEEALTRAFGPDRAREIMTRSIPRIGRIWLSFLEELHPGQLSVLIGRESIEVKALIVAHAAPEVGSRVVSQVSPDQQKAIIRRVARMREVPADIVRTIADSLKERMRTIGTDAARDIEGVSTLAEIMKHLGDNQLLQRIEAELPELGQALSEELYSIEMVHRVRSRILEDILNRLDDLEVARLLKGKEESVRRRILEHVSENRALIISEEYRNLGPQLRSDVDALTHQFVMMLREEDPEAEIVSAQT